MIEVGFGMRRSATPRPAPQTGVKWLGATDNAAKLSLIGKMKRVAA